MNNLIDRQSAIDALVHESACDGSYGYIDTKSATEIIRRLPPAQSKTGHWIAVSHRQDNAFTHPVFIVDGYTCSECGMFNTDKDNFCPNCGANMWGDEDE